MGDRLFRLSVGGACVHKERIVLLRRRDDAETYPSIWELPSGRVEPGENPEEALKREVYEEAGLKVKVGPCLGYFIYMPSGSTECIQLNHICFLEKSIFRSLRISDEHVQAEWVRLGNALGYGVSSEVRKIILTCAQGLRSYVSNP